MMNKSEFNKLYFDAVDNLVRLNQLHSEFFLAPSIKDSRNEWWYLQGFCTVKASIGRRSGKTTYINHRANSKSLIVTSVKKHEYTCLEATICSARQLKRLDFSNLDFDKIYIERSHAIFNIIGEEDFYRMISPLPNVTIILLDY